MVQIRICLFRQDAVGAAMCCRQCSADKRCPGWLQIIAVRTMSWHDDAANDSCPVVLLDIGIVLGNTQLLEQQCMSCSLHLLLGLGRTINRQLWWQLLQVAKTLYWCCIFCVCCALLVLNVQLLCLLQQDSAPQVATVHCSCRPWHCCCR